MKLRLEKAMLVYDASRRETFDALQKWINELLTFCQSPVHLFLVGNKVDVSDLQVTAKEGQEFADKSGAK